MHVRIDNPADHATFNKADADDMAKAATVALYINYTDALGDRWSVHVDHGTDTDTRAKLAIVDEYGEFVAYLDRMWIMPGNYAHIEREWQQIESQLEAMWG